ncbi:Caleosin [Klebsormidium nitens]|uniref:Caleosin n=1 Tax=Klebsormidium nitens TaxID=105231 RepID=A0A1Y1IP03_KLENI|nr:Caleosin [Klebsormidium nitens]|eukprot:GAQ91219.1 Caleosin [Klebsormidium nitens]
MDVATATVAPAAPVTAERPVPADLDQALKNPGLPRALVAPSRERPDGSRAFHDPKSLSVLQQHVEFFDRRKTGIIMPWDTYAGEPLPRALVAHKWAVPHLTRSEEPLRTASRNRFRAVGFSMVLSLVFSALINGSLSYFSQDSWLPDPLLSIKVRNIHGCKHGSDSESYDTEGRQAAATLPTPLHVARTLARQERAGVGAEERRLGQPRGCLFVPEKFEEIFSKHDRSGKGSLTFMEMLALTETNKNAFDAFGWIAEKLEWGVTFWLLADHRGRVAKEHIRECLDGSVFYRIEKERQEEAHRKQGRGHAPASHGHTDAE